MGREVYTGSRTGRCTIITAAAAGRHPGCQDGRPEGTTARVVPYQLTINGKYTRHMPRIGPDEVREIAALARLRLDDAEVERMTHDLDAILGYVDTIKSLDTTDVEPMTHAVPFDCPLREDVPGEPLPIEQALANAPRREDSFFEVPRIITEGR
jgi:aspartyl-tRNA(Asn)/glutamyl-tRNA(Gln) amidotransferase subunit C